MKFNRSVIAKVGAAALALGAMGMTSVAQARDNVYFSIGANVAPGVFVGASNGYPAYGYGGYAAPVYAAPVYAPAPVYVEPAPVYYGYGYGPTVVVRSAPVYYRGHHPRNGYYAHARHHRDWR